MILNSIKNGSRILCVMTVIVISSLGASAVYAHKGATGIVKERMDLFKRNQQHLKSMGRLLAAEDFTTIATLSAQIAEFADDMPEYFPDGSDQSPSEASPRIWQQFDAFRDAAAANAAAARSIEVAARVADKTAIKDAIAATGATCKSCHRMFKD